MADRVGFEPTIPLQVCRISSAVPSTARPPVRRALIRKHVPEGKSLGLQNFLSVRYFPTWAMAERAEIPRTPYG